jgi:predicted TPR repeat methyltransferase
MARSGAVTGVDLSAELVARARAQEAADPLGIRCHVADLADFDNRWDGTAFDGAGCEMATMDVDDLHGTVSAVATTLCPGGWFAISMVHPCSPGNRGGPVQLRTLSTYVNALIDAGFSLDRVVEPSAPVPDLPPSQIASLLRLRHGSGPAGTATAAVDAAVD